MEHHRRDTGQLSDVPQLSGDESLSGVSSGESTVSAALSSDSHCTWVIRCVPSCFMILFQEFPDKQELHRNMLGLLGNVAEVKALRPQLLTPQFITVFR